MANPAYYQRSYSIIFDITVTLLCTCLCVQDDLHWVKKVSPGMHVIPVIPFILLCIFMVSHFIVIHSCAFYLPHSKANTDQLLTEVA